MTQTKSVAHFFYIKKTMSLRKRAPLVERYRPKTLSQVVGQDNVIAVLRGFVKRRNMPNIMLSGVAGVGKTSAAFAFINDFYASFGITDWTPLVLSINASRENGIETIREQITPFATSSYRSQVNIVSTQSNADDIDVARGGEALTVPKIVVLDEADAITKIAQWALGPIIDRTSDNARFIFIVNYQRKIQDDLQSRCEVLRFPPLPRSAVKALINDVCVQEQIAFEPAAAAAIGVVAQNDMRRALNILSSCVVQKKAERQTPLSEQFVFNAAGRVEPAVTLALLDTIMTTSPPSSIKLAHVCESVEQHMTLHNLSLTQLLCDIHEICQCLAAPNPQLDAELRASNALKIRFRQQTFLLALFEEIYDTEQNLLAITDSARMSLQMRAFAAALWKISVS